MKAAVDAAAVLYVAYRLPLAAEPGPYSPECVEGVFSEVRLSPFLVSPRSVYPDGIGYSEGAHGR
jgi:hypothetical protein